jgi:hypothetical protein
MASANIASDANSGSIVAPAPASEFGHIYFDKWQIDATYERRVKDRVIPLGRLVKKELCGRPYDPDILLTFESSNGTKYTHMMEFDSSYRCCNITSV